MFNKLPKNQVGGTSLMDALYLYGVEGRTLDDPSEQLSILYGHRLSAVLLELDGCDGSYPFAICSPPRYSLIETGRRA